MRAQCFNNLDHVIDQVHSLFEGWIEQRVYATCIDEFGLEVLKLAVHEWMANLVQHAAFRTPEPKIWLTVQELEKGLYCIIEDNSEGFDFHAQVDVQSEALNGPEPSERGRGLLMMIACTENLTYETAENGRQRLEFVVRPPVESNELPTCYSTTDKAGSSLHEADETDNA